jgi:uncharacterized DUF497 family protein
MRFEWDEVKNASNFEKHGVWFEEAQTVWADPHATEFYDPDHSTDEDRFIRVGHSRKERVLLVIFSEKHEGKTVRIISARKATPKERKAHEEGIRSQEAKEAAREDDHRSRCSQGSREYSSRCSSTC